MHTGKCPSCGKPIFEIKMEHVPVRVSGGSEYHGTSFQCPLCSAVLSVSIDQISVKVDTVREVLRGMGKNP